MCWAVCRIRCRRGLNPTSPPPGRQSAIVGCGSCAKSVGAVLCRQRALVVADHSNADFEAPTSPVDPGGCQEGLVKRVPRWDEVAGSLLWIPLYSLCMLGASSGTITNVGCSPPPLGRLGQDGPGVSGSLTLVTARSGPRHRRPWCRPAGKFHFLSENS